VDPSAARHLKSMQVKAAHMGCKLICCRTNHRVFDALVAAEVITAPDDDLVQHLRGFRWIAKPEGETSDNRQPRTPKVIPARRPNMPPHCNTFHDTEECEASPAKRVYSPPSRPISWLPPPKPIREPDAFAHETDALDYCDEEIVEQFCYHGRSSDKLKPYMLEYRSACKNRLRLEEWAFEEMNALRPGLMGQLREYCDVYEDLKKWDKVPSSKGGLCFVLRGSISLVQMLAQADDEEDQLEPQVRGFSFRAGKRLRRRYPPGHVVGKVQFFMFTRNQNHDPKNSTKPVVSSKFGDSAEIWVLKYSKWEALPAELKAELTTMLCQMLADDAQHALMQEH